LFGAILLSVLLALPAISACAPKAAPKEKVISYLSLADYTGPIAGLNVPADIGCKDMFADINAKGGIAGVKVNAIFVDTRYDTARGVSAYKRYRTLPNLMLVNAISTALAKAIEPMTAKDKVVYFNPADGFQQAFIGWAFSWGVIYQNAFGATIDFILKDWKAKGKSGTPTVGYLHWDNAYGHEPLLGGREYAEQLGVKLLTEFFPTGAPDHTVWLQRLAAGGVDYIMIGGIDPTPSNIMRDAYKLGLTKTIQFVDNTYWGPTEAIGIKLHPEATQGAWLVTFYLRGDEAWAHPLSQYMVPKYHGKNVDEFRKELGTIYVAGFSWALTYEEAVKRAIADVGYEKLDGEAMKRAMESLTGLDISQGIQGLNTYSPTSRQASDVVKFYQVKGDKEVPITDWIKVPDCVSLHDWGKK
jgi:branched-chain amino acid transport system substrate-binding protein